AASQSPEPEAESPSAVATAAPAADAPVELPAPPASAAQIAAAPPSIPEPQPPAEKPAQAPTPEPTSSTFPRQDTVPPSNVAPSGEEGLDPVTATAQTAPEAEPPLASEGREGKDTPGRGAAPESGP